ncbi:beta-1,3-galactosyltransferase 5 [Biomphalaria glabrata]|nr:beta-1; 3-galactosyltransferase 5-like [Biomphalaria glabrata]KAI8796888.1 beta-1,3-galactosyltransferase 5 [Biomphalaria glabrata]
MYFENSHFVYRQLFNNITKIKDKNVLFSEISEDNFFTNRSFFKKKMSAHNVFSFKTLISGESICSQVRPYVLIIILSQIEHSKLREAIRRTWLKSAERNSWPRFNITKTIKHVFLFGYRQHKLLHDTQVLQKESDKYGDIVALDFIDTYKNLSLKVINGVEWTLKYCNGVEFLLKVDEDTLINVPLMIELLTHVSRRRNNDAFVLGKIHWNPKPEVSRKGRWKVSEQMYPFPYYPLYLYGHSYAINRAALRIISVTVKRIRWVTPEDAFITGILPVFAGIQRLHAPSFTVCCRRTYDCEVIWNKNVAITSTWNAKRLKRLWAGILLNKCNPDVPFYNI